MKIETTRRRAHIEIIDHTKIKITNSFRQRVFDMEKMVENNLKIDLVFLSLTEDPSIFVGFVYNGGGVAGNPYVFHVCLYNPSSKYGFGVVDVFKIGEQREGTVEVTVVEENG